MTQQSDPVTQSLSQGDVYSSKHDYEKALDAYRKADKLAHHGSALAYLKIASIERKVGDVNAALDDAKRARQAAGDNKVLAIESYLFRASLLAQMSGKPTDKKLKEAEEETRQALALDPDYPAARFSLGITLLKQERDTDGVAELNKFLSLPRADAGMLADARRFVATPIRAREPFAPDFSFTTLESQNISNATLRGKVVLLDFWGTWCPPCRESVPMLRDLNKKYAGKPFQLVGISSDEDERVWRAYIEKERMSWSEYIDLSGKVQEAFRVESYPTYIVLDKDGVVRFRQSGMSDLTGGDLTDAINKAIKRSSDPALASAALAAPEAAAETPKSAIANQPTGDPATTPLTGIETWSVSGSVYKNEELGISFELPKGWTAATATSLHEYNERNQAQARASFAQQHPEISETVIVVPRTVLYASLRGGTADRLSLPCLRVSANPRMPPLTLDRFTDLMQRSAQTGGKLSGDPAEVMVNRHRLFRADMEMTSGATRFYRTYVQTRSGGYAVTLEFFASSKEELQRIAAALNSLAFEEEEE